MQRLNKLVPLCLILLCGALSGGFSTPAATDWPPVNPAELALKDNPAEPGATAMILYREVLVNSVESTESYYLRVKIFTEEGKKYADVEIPFLKGDTEVKDVHSRTIHPDGKILVSDARVMEKEVIKAGDIRIQQKSFTMPDVTPGSIIEYRYKIQRDPNFLYNITWHLQEDIYTQRAHFVFKPYQGPEAGNLLWRGLRANGATPQKQKDGSWVLDVHDLPGLPDEEFMLPEDELRGKIDFIYSHEDHTNDPKVYWDRTAKLIAEADDKFIGKRNSIRDLVTQLVKPEDPPEAKLRKLYTRAQQIHNIDEDPEKTKQEEKREKIKDNSNVDDILKRGTGDNNDVIKFFVALAQAAGFDSSVVRVTLRTDGMFHREFQDRSELDDLIAWVKAGDKEYFLDPAVHACPFGLLPWYETYITGLRATKSGAEFVQVPAPPPSVSLTERKAQLTLESDGSLSGTLVVRFTGERALTHRLNAKNGDEIGRKKQITDEIKGWLPSNAKFSLESITGWDTADTPLEASGKLQLPGLAEAVGRRVLLPIGLYEAGHRQLFDASARKQDVVFHYPYEDLDTFVIQLPPGLQAGTLPPPQVVNPGAQMRYEISAKQDGQSLSIQRRLDVGSISFPVNTYGVLRNFFGSAKSNDEQQVVLQAAPAGKN